MKPHALLVLLAACAGLAACKGPGPKMIGEATLALANGVEEVPAAAENAPVVEILPDQPATIPDAPLVKLAIDRQTTWGQVKASLDIMDARGQTPVLLVAERRKLRAFARFDQIDAGELQAGPPADAPDEADADAPDEADADAPDEADADEADADEADADEADADEADADEADADEADADADEADADEADADAPERPFAALTRNAIELTAYTDGKVCVRHSEIPEAKCVQTPSKQYIDGAFTRQLVREAIEGYGQSKVVVDLPVNLEWDDVVRVVDGARTCCQQRDVRVHVLPPEAFPERIQVPAE